MELAVRAHEIQAMLDADKPLDGEAAARTALDQAQTALGSDSPVTADLNRLLGDALYSQGRYDEAERSSAPRSPCGQKSSAAIISTRRSRHPTSR